MKKLFLSGIIDTEIDFSRSNAMRLLGNNNGSEKLILFAILLCFCTSSFVFGQQSDADVSAAAVEGEAEVEELLPEAEDKRLEPVFPLENPGIIHLEAEDAVSTNFAKEPTLNYSASRFRTLQLNRYTGLYGGAAFFAEYVIYVERPGEYEMWYGGTPPGPEEDLFPSYASPFSYRVDNGPSNPIYRENVNVVDGYTPGYYWVKVGPIVLEAGIHTIRFEISEKRRFDGKYFFYLDSLFFIDREIALQGNLPLPDLFPVDLDNTLLDEPFRSINDYQYLISVEPNNVWLYIEFSLIYSMLGDYLNALKNLNRAALIDPDNTYVALLTAKNRIWKGDAEEGLRAYQRLLELDTSQRDIWAEAGKVAAWISKYNDSIQFFNDGLSKFPGDLNLTVNLGLTFLWNSQEDQAEEQFREAERIASESADRIEELGNIYLVNGYPQKALDLFRNSIRDFPEVLSLYLNLESAYTEVGRTEDAEKIHTQISDRFVPSDRLSSYLETFSIKQGLKEEVISGFQRALAEEPDNLELRDVLVQTYFWNGLRERAIEEYLNILTNHAYRHFIDFDKRSMDLMELIDTLYLYDGFIKRYPADLPALKTALNEKIGVYRNAVRANERHLADVEKAKEKDESPPEPEVDPAQVVATAEYELADLVETVQETVNSFDTHTLSVQPFLDSVGSYIDQENQDTEAFANLVSSLNWRWDRTAFVDELTRVAENGVVLADHVLARLYQIERRTELADERLIPVIQDGRAQTASLFAYAEIGLWRYGTFVADDLPAGSEKRIEEYAPFVVGCRIWKLTC